MKRFSDDEMSETKPTAQDSAPDIKDVILGNLTKKNLDKENIVNPHHIQAANSARTSQVPGQVLAVAKDVQSSDQVLTLVKDVHSSGQAPTLSLKSCRPDQLKTPIKAEKIKLEPKVSVITFLALSHVVF